MFFILSKFFAFIFMPIGFFTVLMLYGLSIKNRNESRRILIAALIFLLISCNPFIINELLLCWEVPPTPISQLSSYDVAIVLTGGITNDDKLPNENTFLGSSADRIGQAIQLYQKGKIRKILISGGSTDIIGFSPKQEANDAARFLMLCGVPAKDIFLDTLSKNTHENAVNSSRILKKQFPNQRYLLITSATHLRRATKCFEKAGIKITPFGANYVSHERQFIPSYIFPKEEYWYYSELLAHEWFGYITYWLLGYI